MRGLGPLEVLSACLARLPGVGRRSADRMAMAIVRDPDGLGTDLVGALQQARITICACSRCGATTLKDRDPCVLCASPQRNGTQMCVVEDPTDIQILEKSGAYNGRYHALMGRLSPAKRVGPAQLRIQALLDRITAESITEVILALSTDMEGEATANYLADALKACRVTATRLAFGIPAGSGIAYADSVTLGRAIKGRGPL